MTEFDLKPENGVSKRQFDLCVIDSDGTNNCNGDYVGISNTCGTVTDNGQYIISDDRGYLWKLGTCGLEKMDGLKMDNWNGGQFCGKIPGGAIFCTGKTCYKYDDSTKALHLFPQLNDWHTGIF